MSLIKYIKDCFIPPSVEKPMSARELTALRNLVYATRERLWLSESYPRKPDYHLDFEEDLAEDKQRILTDSLQTIDSTIKRHREMVENGR